MKLKRVTSLIEKWAEERGIYENATAVMQLVKTHSELNELMSHCFVYGEVDREKVKDDIGDITVCIINAGKMLGIKVFAPVKNKHEETTVTQDILFVSEQLHKAMVECIESKDVKKRLRNITSRLKVIASKLQLDYEDCVTSAYNEIKDRKGKMINGLFVKEV